MLPLLWTALRLLYHQPPFGPLPRDHIHKVLSSTGQIKHNLGRQLLAEFMGVLLFEIFGGAAPSDGGKAAPANGFALVAIGGSSRGIE